MKRAVLAVVTILAGLAAATLVVVDMVGSPRVGSKAHEIGMKDGKDKAASDAYWNLRKRSAAEVNATAVHALPYTVRFNRPRAITDYIAGYQSGYVAGHNH